MATKENKIIFNIPTVFNMPTERELSAVVFVLDYLQLQFAWATMTINIYPLVEVEGQTYKFNDSDYRNKICEQIGKKVGEIYEENEKVIISFIDGSNITVSREMNIFDLPEVIVFEDGENPILIW